MAQLKDYYIYCETEGKEVFGPTTSDTVPTVCPINPAHTVRSGTASFSNFYALDNYEATSAPTTDDDVNLGYVVGSKWINLTTGRLFVCVDNTPTEALWIQPSDNSPSIQFSRNNIVSNSYLNSSGGVYSNESPYILPFNAKLIAITAATDSAASWTAEVRVGLVLVTGAFLTISSATQGATSLDINLSLNDDVSVFANGTSIDKPNVTLFFERR